MDASQAQTFFIPGWVVGIGLWCSVIALLLWARHFDRRDR